MPTDRFVDPRDGDDGLGDGLTETTAYKTIAKVNPDMVGGDTCFLMPGIFDRADGIIPNGGNSFNQKIYKALQKHTAIITSKTFAGAYTAISSTQNYSVDGLVFLNMPNNILPWNGSGASSLWKNIIFKDCVGGQISKQVTGGTRHHSAFENCVFDSCGTGATISITTFIDGVAGHSFGAGFRNNLMVNCNVGTGFMLQPLRFDIDHTGWHSNIFLNNTCGFFMLFSSGADGTVDSIFGGINNNFYFGNSNTDHHQTSTQLHATLASFQSATGAEGNSSLANPGVLDSVAGLYKIGPGGAAAGAGLGGIDAGPVGSGDGLSQTLNAAIWDAPTITAINGGGVTQDVNGFFVLNQLPNSGVVLEFDGILLGSFSIFKDFYRAVVETPPGSVVTKDFTGTPVRVIIEIRFAVDISSLGAASYQDVQVGTNEPNTGDNAYQLKVTLRNDG